MPPDKGAILYRKCVEKQTCPFEKWHQNHAPKGTVLRMMKQCFWCHLFIFSFLSALSIVYPFWHQNNFTYLECVKQSVEKTTTMVFVIFRLLSDSFNQRSWNVVTQQTFLYSHWGRRHLPVIIDACHEKTDLKVFVVVIPKEGLVGPHQSFFGYDTDYRI